MNRIEKIGKGYEGAYNSDLRNEVFKGLQILSKYSDDISINPAHDEIYAGFEDKSTYEHMSEEDINDMFKLNWRWDEESFRIFV